MGTSLKEQTEWFEHVMEDAKARTAKLHGDLEAERARAATVERDLAEAKLKAEATPSDSPWKERAQAAEQEHAHLRQNLADLTEQRQGALVRVAELEEHVATRNKDYAVAIADAHLGWTKRHEALESEHAELVRTVRHALGLTFMTRGEPEAQLSPVEIVRLAGARLRASPPSVDDAAEKQTASSSEGDNTDGTAGQAASKAT